MRNGILGLTLNLVVYSGVLFAETGQDLFRAAIQGEPQRVHTILSSGGDVNSQVRGRTALMVAAYSGNYRVMQVLIAYGANVNLADSQGSTALMDAIVFGDPRLVHLLISAGADVNAEDKLGVRVLVKAKKSGHTQLLKILEEAGAKEQEEVKVETEPEGKKEGESAENEKVE
jgi:ankyrin repeat protein